MKEENLEKKIAGCFDNDNVREYSSGQKNIISQKESHHKRKEKGWFKFNNKYMTICLYALFVVFWGTIIFILVMNWKDTKGFINNLFNVLSPFFIAILIAYFLSPMVDRLDGFIQEKIARGKGKKLTKYIAMIISYIVVMGFVVVGFVFVIPQMGQSMTELTNNVPEGYNQVLRWLGDFKQKYPDIDVDSITHKLNKMMPDLINYGTNMMGNVIPMVFSVSVSILKSVVNILLSIIISVYMITGKSMFRRQAKRLVYSIFNEETGNAVCKTCRECNDIFSAFLISKAIDSLIIGCLCCIIMNILHLPYAVLISVIVGITNMIPYFGPFIGAVPGVVIYICTKPQDAIVFVIMILVLQQFDGLVLGPRLLGQSTGLNPMWVIFGITVGGAYFGVVGMFIGVPVVAVLAFLLNKIISYRLRGKRINALEEFKNNQKTESVK